MSSKDQTKPDRFNRFAWRDDVFASTDIPAGPKCLAYGIAQFINCETGKAKVGTRKLAKACGNSQTWVCDTIPLLAATGWMQVLEKGRRGSGDTCAGVYKMNRAREHTGCSLSDAVQTPSREHFSTPREHPGCSEPLNHKKSAADAARSADVDAVGKNLVNEPISESATVVALADVKKAYVIDYHGTPEDDAKCQTHLHRLQTKNIPKVRIIGYVARAGRDQFEGAAEPLSDILRELDRG